jgi:hypothetical protein
MANLFQLIMGPCQLTKVLIRIALLILLAASCSRDLPVLDYNEHFNEQALKLCDSQKTELEVNFCTVLIKTPWEKIYIIKPYSLHLVDRLNLKNSGTVKRQLSDLRFGDQKCAMLFVSNDVVEAISWVDHSPSVLYFNNEEVPVITEHNCIVLLKRKSFEGNSYYVFEEIKPS